jgi:predicted nucleic acid-binding protein
VILVDTSIWVDHLRSGDAVLAALLERGNVLAHPWVIGELALGGLPAGSEVHILLSALPTATVATDGEILALVDRHGLGGSGIGYVDAQLLASTLMTADATLWTRDRRLAAAAERIGRAAKPQ